MLAAAAPRAYTGRRKKGGMGMLSENLRRARAASGLSQTELAAKLNVVRQTVSKWETGLSHR